MRRVRVGSESDRHRPRVRSDTARESPASRNQPVAFGSGTPIQPVAFGSGTPIQPPIGTSIRESRESGSANPRPESPASLPAIAGEPGSQPVGTPVQPAIVPEGESACRPSFGSGTPGLRDSGIVNPRHPALSRADGASRLSGLRISRQSERSSRIASSTRPGTPRAPIACMVA